MIGKEELGMAMWGGRELLCEKEMWKHMQERERESQGQFDRNVNQSNYLRHIQREMNWDDNLHQVSDFDFKSVMWEFYSEIHLVICVHMNVQPTYSEFIISSSNSDLTVWTVKVTVYLGHCSFERPSVY